MKCGSLLHRLTHTLGMGIASICHGDIAGTEREVLERFARMHIADEHRDNCKVIRSIAIWRRWSVPAAPGA